MQSHKISWLGLGVVGFGLFVLLVAIPHAVTSPSNVRAIVLSPTFWPVIVSWLIIFLGAVLILMTWLAPPLEQTDLADDTPASHRNAWLRLFASALVMVGLIYFTDLLGLVWMAILAFVVLSIIVRAPRPIVSLVVAIALPLILYGFFNHVAGVAVPQGEFIRLP